MPLARGPALVLLDGKCLAARRQLLSAPDGQRQAERGCPKESISMGISASQPAGPRPIPSCTRPPTPRRRGAGWLSDFV
ncbi:hypothetical protein P4O66_003405 [Electrophorus voltai]|uniref:Uncharacterized protein n=1 Tax=Electrophorus voltai TaxID=2609070 RepID=A0AAD9DK47_9TELE|nr:hypothetical protein P4O66_003405 [Electrophorus voltai]